MVEGKHNFMLLTAILTFETEPVKVASLHSSFKTMLFLEFPVNIKLDFNEIVTTLTSFGIIGRSGDYFTVNDCYMSKFLNRLIYPVFKQYQTFFYHLGTPSK